jgi:hypothetical protein
MARADRIRRRRPIVGVAFALAVGSAALGCAHESDTPTIESEIDRSRGRMTDAELQSFRQAFQVAFDDRLEAARTLSGTPPLCRNGAAVLHYVDALDSEGRYPESLAFATRCLSTENPSTEHHLAAGRAAWFARDPSASLRHIERAALAAEGAPARAVACERASAIQRSFARQRADDIDQVLRAAFGEDENGKLVVNLVGGALGTRPFELTIEREARLFALVDSEDPKTAAWLLYYYVVKAISGEFRYHDALKVIASSRGQILLRELSPTMVYGLALLVHRALMNHRNNDLGYREARELVKSTIRFQRKEVAPFILGFSPFTPSEVRASVCPTAFTTGEDARRLAAIKQELIAGTLSPTEGLRRLPNVGKADVEVVRGTLLEALQDDAGALDAYWSARRLCPYYSRATAGTTGTASRLVEASLPDAFRPTLPGPPPPAFAEYVLNDKMLSSRQRLAVAYGTSFWWPYLHQLAAGKAGVYVAPTFQGLSETPARFEGSDAYRYPDDGRLFDDLEGSGGTIITVSNSAAQNWTWGVTVHEAAHQFHGMAAPHVQSCITLLFGEARRRNVFASGYAATNEKEYFAVGVQDYAAPIGYGTTTRDWYRANDPRLLRFIASVEASAGDMGHIACAP